MSNVIRSIVWVGMAVASIAMFGAVARAYELVASPHELTASPLYVTGYQRTNAYSLTYLQLFNNGSQPIDLNKWSVKLNVEGENILPPTKGYLLPGEHTVLAAPDVSIDTDTSALLAYKTEKPLERIAVFPPEDTLYTTDIYSFKSTPASKSASEILTEPWRRTMSSKNTYSSSLTAFELADEQLYFDPLYMPPATAAGLQLVEIYPYSSSCAPSDESVLCRDYVKLYNPTTQTIPLDSYVLRSDSGSTNRTGSNTIKLTGQRIEPGQYLSVSMSNAGTPLSLTNSGGYVWLEDEWGLRRYDDTITEYPSAGMSEQGMSWAQDDDGVWSWSSTPKPLAANQFPPRIVEAPATVVTDCPAGKYRNPDTNRCRTVEEAVNALAVCPEGQVRNPETNRCRSMVLAVSSLAPCLEGQERNPATNRCRSIASAVAELLPCDEGFERNPSTNRCKKIVSNVTNGAMPTAPLTKNEEGSLPLTLAIAVGVGAVGYGVYEWRHELWRSVRKVIPHKA